MNDQSWQRETEKLIDCIDNDTFPSQLIDSLSVLAPFTMTAIFINRGRSRPVCLYDTFPDEKSKSGIRNYVNGTYVLNPAYRAHCRGIQTGVYRMRDLAPDEYYKHDLNTVDGISRSELEEIGFVTSNWPEQQEELIIAVSVGKETTVEIDLFSPLGVDAYRDSVVRRLEDHVGLIGAIVRKYWMLRGCQKIEHPIDARIDELFDNFGKPELSDREQQVMQHVLRGYSSASMSEILDISVTTVKTHRKRAYAKLNISSQSELLSLFLKSAGPFLISG